MMSRTPDFIIAGTVGCFLAVAAYGQDVSQVRGGQQSTITLAANSQSADDSASSADQPAGNVAQNPPATVGQAPEAKSSRPPAVAQIFEQPGLLTPRGSITIEPSVQYSYASSNRVTLVGYTVIPAILIGLIDIKSVNRNTFIGALTMRYGVTNRFELETKVPYVYRSDTVVSRSLNTGATQDTTSNTIGKGLGDVEFTARLQMNAGGADTPYYIGFLRVKTRTGKSPFDVKLDANNVQESLPTGSGFYGIQPGLTVIFPSDPAVFFGGMSYQVNLWRGGASLGPKFGSINPGDIIDVNFGMGLALNEKASFSLGYDHSVIGKDTINGAAPPDATVTQLASLLLGYSYRLSDTRSFNLALAAGLTQDTPDMQLTLRWPTNF